MSGYELAQGQPRCGNLGRSVASQNSAPRGLRVHRSPSGALISGTLQAPAAGQRVPSPLPEPCPALPRASHLPPSPVTRPQPVSTRHTAPTPDSYPGRTDR